jgi:hypothetical protein
MSLSDADTTWMSRIAMNIPTTMKKKATTRLIGIVSTVCTGVPLITAPLIFVTIRSTISPPRHKTLAWVLFVSSPLAGEGQGGG